MRRLMQEIASLQNEPKEGIRIQTDEANILDVTGIIEGPGE
jgi:ubiquitin-protein ligase